MNEVCCFNLTTKFVANTTFMKTNSVRMFSSYKCLQLSQYKTYIIKYKHTLCITSIYLCF